MTTYGFQHDARCWKSEPHGQIHSRNRVCWSSGDKVAAYPRFRPRSFIFVHEKEYSK